MIYYISGGQRSGKTKEALKLARSLSERPVYLATSRVWDASHQARIARHRAERDASWENIEVEKALSGQMLAQKVVVLDCITLWLTNIYTDHKYEIDPTLAEAKKEFDIFVQQDFTLIVISNEIGMGTHATTSVGRNFADLQGWMNQYIAEKANSVTFMVSGIPLKIK